MKNFETIFHLGILKQNNNKKNALQVFGTGTTDMDDEVFAEK